MKKIVCLLFVAACLGFAHPISAQSLPDSATLCYVALSQGIIGNFDGDDAKKLAKICDDAGASILTMVPSGKLTQIDIDYTAFKMYEWASKATYHISGDMKVTCVEAEKVVFLANKLIKEDTDSADIQDAKNAISVFNSKCTTKS